MICPACGSAAVHVGPTSRRTASVVARCSACRAQFLVEETTEPTAVVTTDEVSVEYVSDWVGKKREGVGPAVWREKLAWLSKEVADIDKPKKRRSGGPPLRVVTGGLDDLEKRPPPKEKRYLN